MSFRESKEFIMSFFDKAKSKILGSFGEETIKEIDKPKNMVEEEESSVSEVGQEGIGEGVPSERVSLVQEEIVFDEEPGVMEGSSSDFSLSEDSSNFFKEQQAAYEEEMKKFEGVPNLRALNNKIQDVLKVLRIPADIIIEEEYFLPDDIKEIEFDTQAPYGYEMSQVNAFVENTKKTVEEYVRLITERNKHVAQLATVVDRLQIDLHNMKYESLSANGINVMTGNTSEDLENELMEARLEIKRLESKINNTSDNLTSTERKQYETIQDNLALLRRENNTLTQKNQNLRLANIKLQQELEEHTETQLRKNVNEQYNNNNDELPDNNEDDSLDLPDEEPTLNTTQTNNTTQQPKNSVFALHTTQEINTTFTLQEEQNTPEEEDDIDELFQSLQNNTNTENN